MKAHTSSFKENIKLFGRELDSKITYEQDGVTIELGSEQLNSVTPHYEGAILKSVMKQLDIDSNIEIPVGTELNYQFGVKTRSGKNLLTFNNVSDGTGNNVSYSFNNSILTLNGTTTTSDHIISFNTNTGITLPAGNYTWTIFNLSGNYNISGSPGIDTALYLRTSTISVIANTTLRNKTFPQKISFTLSEDTTIYVQIYSNSAGQVFNNLRLGYQVESGDGTTEFEQYGAYDYVNYGNYIVKDVEKQEDMRSWKITCYDKMLYSMVDYEAMNITYPITIRNYISTICSHLGLTFKNSSDTFANYDKTIPNELYLDENGKTLGYKFRDVLDELAQVTASTICINEDDDELEIRYINDTVGKNLLKNTNVNSGDNNYWYNYSTYDKTTRTLTRSTTATTESFITHKLDDLKSNTTYTLSLYAKSNGYVSSMDFYMFNSSIQGIKNKSGMSLTTEFQKYTWTFTTASNIDYSTNTSIRIDNNGSTTSGTEATLTIKNVMLEEDSTASEYEDYGDTIDEEYLKDINVNFGEKFGSVNVIVLSRSADADNIYYPTTLPDNPVEMKISDNQIMNFNNRDTFMPDIYNKLNGLEYYINDFSSTGICYYNLCDRYNVKIGENIYSCIMFNDEVNITQGLEENVYTDMPEETNTEYSKADSTDRKINGAYIIANKQEGRIDEVVSRLSDDEETLSETVRTQDAMSERFEVISEGFDSDGNAIRVKTINGYVFDENGLNIYTSENSFNTQITNEGTYYKDGDTIVGQYTKDGSKQKDLSLFGVYYYGMNNKDATPMFVAQLYTDENGEEGFGHFFNGGDY